jgi:pyruvate ferredoxin oxidoreductase delta subunit
MKMTFRAFRPEIDQDQCKRCGLCATYCPEGVIAKMDNDYYIDYRHCKGCGICSNECPSHAINMAREKEAS